MRTYAIVKTCGSVKGRRLTIAAVHEFKNLGSVREGPTRREGYSSKNADKRGAEYCFSMGDDVKGSVESTGLQGRLSLLLFKNSHKHSQA